MWCLSQNSSIIAFMKCTLAKLDRTNRKVSFGSAGLLTMLPPVLILPIRYLVFKEKIGWQAISGTILSIR